MTASLLSSARAALDLWSDPEVARLTAAQTVEIGRLRRQPTVIYLIVPEHKISYFSVILNLFYTACFEHCLTAWDAGDPAGTPGSCRSPFSSTSSATSASSTTSPASSRPSGSGAAR